MAQQNRNIYGRSAKRRAARRRRKAAVRITGLAVGLLAFLALAYLAGASLLGSLADRKKDDPNAPRYTGTAPFVVAIDAGHGGGDVGAVGLLNECDMTAATAAELTALLEADPNFTPVQTRADYNTAAQPAERAAEANRQKAQLLLSIHGNSDPSGTAFGFESYPVPPGRARHTNSLAFAEMLAGQMQAAGQTLRAGNGIRYAYYEGSEKILVDSSDATERDEPTFGILEKADCPAVLAEQCFVTNADDVAAFGGEEGCKAAARCYYYAICAYFDTQPLV